jgi:cell division protein FtsB
MNNRNYTRIDRGTREGRRKKLLLAAGVLLGIYFLASSILGEMGLVKYFRMKSRHSSLTDEIAMLKQDNVRLRREVRALKTDPAYIEKLARDNLGLARKGEIVYYYADTNFKSQAPNPE